VINVRINTTELRSDRTAEVAEWIRSTLDIDPTDLGPWMLLKRADGTYKLHLSKRRRSPSGGIVLDQASGDIVSEPLVVSLTAEQYQAMPKLGIEAVAR
jgi:hypothetical protein